MKEKLLLHVCCAPCAIYPLKILQDRFDLVLVFYGPNIHPIDEYLKRLESAKQLSEKIGLSIIELEYNPKDWYELIKGLEEEPEGGKRCKVCYSMRLERIAKFAKKNGYRNFTTTLTLSPHKPASVINPIGESIAKEYGLVFLAEDFKKKDGFKKSCQLSDEYGLYRQKYCGCEYSPRTTGSSGSS